MRQSQQAEGERQAGIAAKMYECRIAARQILGDAYHDKMQELAQVLTAVKERDA